MKQQTAQFVAGNLQSPEYRTHRALDTRAVAAGGPGVAASDAAEHRQHHACGRQGLSRRDHPPRSHHPRGDRRCVRRRGARSDRRWFGDWRATGAMPNTTPAPVPPNAPAAVAVADAEAVQDTVYLAEQLQLNRFDPDLLSPRARHPCARRRILRDASLSRSAPGRGLCLHGGCAPRCREDPRRFMP